MTVLGIDPAKGWAVARDGTIIGCGTVPGFSDLWAYIRKLSSMGLRIDQVVIEKPKNLHVYWRKNAVNHLSMQKIAVNVGQNRAYADMLVEFCRELGYNVRTIAPVKKFTKLKHDQFCRITGWDSKKRTSEHARDAGMIAYLESR